MPPMQAPVVSAATAAILLFLQMILLVGVVLQRRNNQQSLGDGNKPALLQSIRRHGNLAENAGIFVVTLALFEMLGGNLLQVEIFAGAFVIGRLLHAIGLSLRNPTNVFRLLGAVLTLLVGFGLALRLALLVLPLLPH